jgi:hypothetical protein
MVGREGVEGEQVVLGLLEQLGALRERRAQSLQCVTDELARKLTGVGVEERADQRRQHRLLLAARVPRRFAEEMDAAALPGAAEHLRDRSLEAGVRVRDV